MKKPRGIKTAFLILSIFCMLLTFPVKVQAANKTVKIANSDIVTDIAKNIKEALDSIGSGDTVTVEGSKTNVPAEQLFIDIAQGKKVIWKATYNGQGAVNARGKGTLEVAKGASFKTGGNTESIIGGNGMTIIVSGGAITNDSANRATVFMPDGNANFKMTNGTITSTGEGGMGLEYCWANNTINISGGTIKATGNGAEAITSFGTGTLNISGGTIESTKGHAIGIAGTANEITISKGTIKGSSTSNKNGIIVEAASKQTVIKVSGGTITAKLRAIENSGEDTRIIISNGTLEGGESAVANGTAGKTAKIEISGGVLNGGYYGIINTGVSVTVSVTGGRIETTSKASARYAIYATTATNIFIKGGTVAAGDGNAIRADHASSMVEISNGFVFAYGNKTRSNDEYSVVRVAGAANLVISGDAVVVAWDRDNHMDEIYKLEDIDTDLYWGSGLCDGSWWNTGKTCGIKYERGKNKGFYEIKGVKVELYDHTIVFETNGGSPIKNAQVLNDEKLPKPVDPTKDGFNFVAWFTDKNLTKKYDFNTKVIDGFTLYAKWEAKDGTSEIDKKNDDEVDDVIDDDIGTDKDITDKKPKDNNLILILAIAGIVVVGGGLGFVLLKKKPKKDEAPKSSTPAEKKVEEAVDKEKTSEAEPTPDPKNKAEETKEISEEVEKSEILFCTKCGKELAVGALFCTKCGQAVEK